MTALLIRSLLFSLVLLNAASLACAQPATPKRWKQAAIGVTRAGTEIPVWLNSGAGNPKSQRNRMVVIGGHDGSTASTNFVQQLVERANTSKPNPNNGTAFIPKVFPDGLSTDLALTAGKGYPPGKGFYDDAAQPEPRYLWRWVGMYGATLVVDVRAGKTPGYWASEHADADQLAKLLAATPFTNKIEAPPADDFVRQLAEKGVEDVGRVPTLLLHVSSPVAAPEVEAIAKLLASFTPSKSPAWDEIIWRERRTPEQIAASLATVYGHDLKQVAYIPALAVIGRQRIAVELNDQKEQESLKQLLAPFLEGEKSPVPKSGSEHAGHLLFAELAKRSEGKDRERWIELCRAAADQIFDKDGKPLKLMPSHNEMSDAVFMATPILCATGKLTGEQKYFDAAVGHFRSMKKLCVREDGIYRHSPLDEAAWGRGNGFPALGLAWALSEFPEDHPAHGELKKEFQNHIAALLKHQDSFGCWHQVIDKPGSYREFSSTCMIGWALKRGIDRGWLDKGTHQPALDQAWLAAKHRIGPKGKVVDICTGTGKMRSLRDYYDRPAIWGVDARGGAMALMFSTEMMDGTK
ncbi:Unsaturated rhamnogalacturonyl hydrolase YteR [Anatilimnocola aggregata]|uniref:Unsaturated rhamnogalacturonyl hydrolase YteR n=1 Tax=Anatilimnocola aggregata TaxID=2528021 RepID=A0A517YGI7_9BACT|nr:glycoside hydrolase family 88 protein [Anatilimnocola aggregata]QDU29343.1 Unsaturated rhamnogalacturonyl hydrolase YteR [Anatilimnocola aggregata]